ncbi:MAG: STM4015 family protein [Lachnospiraceae bacterium]
MEYTKSKCYSFEYEEYEEQGKNQTTMLQEILNDKELPELEEINIGCWGEMWEDSCQELLDGIVEHKDAFAHIKSLCIGDVDFEICEISWIIQGDYSKLWDALPNLEHLLIKGSTELELGDISHSNLKCLEILCGGLPGNVIKSVTNAKLPNLECLRLYLGSDNYGFDGDAQMIQELLEKTDFPKLVSLALMDSEMQDEVTKLVLESKYISQVNALDFSLGTLTDEVGALLLETIPKYPNIEYLNIDENFLSDEMVEKLMALPIEVESDSQKEDEEYDGEIWRYASVTE